MSNMTINNRNYNFSISGPLQMHEPDSYALSGKIMLSAIVILFAVVVFMIGLHVYARWYLLRMRRRIQNRRRSRRQRASHIVFYVDPNAASSTANRGLDADVIKSLPLFVYSPLTHRDITDCAVCLSEFEENEAGRVLPKCHHSFHTDCIDMWFHSHSTCPICRAPVEPVQPNDKISIVVEKPAGSSSEEGGGGVNTTSLADRRKGMDLSGVKIEVPSRAESVSELRLSSPASHGFRSPGNRLQSLKRILSMSIRPAAVSPSSGIGTSCGTAGSESDVELGSNPESTPR